MTTQTIKGASFSFWMAAVVLLAIGAPTTATAQVTVSACNEAALTGAISNIQAAGEVFIQCNGEITLTKTIEIFSNVTIDAAGQNVVISGANSVSVFAVFAGATLNLRNLGIAHGKANLEGGGILNKGNLRVSRCSFFNNSATGDPEHRAQGGAIANHGDLVVVASSFTGNSVQNGDGGAISSDGTGVFIGDSLFSSLFPVSAGNSASRFGGVIYNQAGLLTIRNCRFIPFGFTPANAAGDTGGAIYNTGTLNVINTSFSGNYVPQFGGGIYSSGGPSLVSKSTFDSNDAFDGMAIFNDKGALSIINSTFNRNHSSTFVDASAITNTGTLSIDYSTLGDNSGVGILNGAGGNATVSDTILFANSGQFTCQNNIGNLIDGGYNLENQARCGFSSSNHSLSNTNPSFDILGLANNGGPTQTIALNADSPAIDQIPPGTNGCGTTVTTDQRGVPRPTGIACDIGAYEASQSVPQSAHLCNGAFTGAFASDLIVSAGQTCTFLGGSINGNILLQGGQLNLSYVTVSGNLEATGGSFTIGPSTNVGGNLEIHDYPPTPVLNTICGSNIGGNLHVHDNASAVTIGSADFGNACEGNTIGVNMDVHNNSAPTQIFDNLIKGSLDVHNNIATVQVIDNTVTSALTCNQNSSITGGPNPGSSQVGGQCYQVVGTSGK